MVNNKKNTPSLDLSFVYGSDTLRKLSERDIACFVEEHHVSTGDTTIRAVTSLFSGRRRIEGLAAYLRGGYDPYNSADDADDFR